MNSGVSGSTTWLQFKLIRFIYKHSISGNIWVLMKLTKVFEIERRCKMPIDTKSNPRSLLVL